VLQELEVDIFIRLQEEPDRAADILGRALGTSFTADEDEALELPAYNAQGLGFGATLWSNEGEALDPEFEDYHFGLTITSQYWCVDLDTVDLESGLSEYYARLLAFHLNVETATEILLETTEDAEILEIRTFKRNPQYRLDQSPTVPRVFVAETRTVEAPFDDEDDVEDEDGTEF